LGGQQVDLRLSLLGARQMDDKRFDALRQRRHSQARVTVQLSTVIGNFPRAKEASDLCAEVSVVHDPAVSQT
jgi:chromosome condensin MukBEF complex kleisin-like MukF subunit